MPLVAFYDLDQELGRWGQPRSSEIAAQLGVSLPALPSALAQPKIRDLTLRAQEDPSLVAELFALLPATDIVELIEEAYCLETVSQELPWLRALTLLLPDRIDGRAALVLATERLAKRGALRRTRIRGSLFQCFAIAAARVPAIEEEIIEKLLQEEPRVFEFPAFELLRGAVERLSIEARVRVLSNLETTSFAEPNEPWSLFDLIPSVMTAKRLLGLVEDEENEPFFLGAGAARVVEVLAAQGHDAIPLLVASAMRTDNRLRAVVFAALATIDGGASELAAFAEDPDARIATIARKGRLAPGDLLSLGIDPTSTDRGGRAKGGVIGRDGKPWRG